MVEKVGDDDGPASHVDATQETKKHRPTRAEKKKKKKKNKSDPDQTVPNDSVQEASATDGKRRSKSGENRSKSGRKAEKGNAPPDQPMQTQVDQSTAEVDHSRKQKKEQRRKEKKAKAKSGQVATSQADQNGQNLQPKDSPPNDEDLTPEQRAAKEARREQRRQKRKEKREKDKEERRKKREEEAAVESSSLSGMNVQGTSANKEGKRGRRRNRGRSDQAVPDKYADPHKKNNQRGGEKHFRGFTEYWSLVDVEKALNRNDKRVVRGKMIINARNTLVAYVKSPAFERDVCVEGHRSRNRALPNDEVAVEIFPKRRWRLKLKEYLIREGITPKEFDRRMQGGLAGTGTAEDLAEELNELDLDLGSNATDSEDDADEDRIADVDEEEEDSDLSPGVKGQFSLNDYDFGKYGGGDGNNQKLLSRLGVKLKDFPEDLMQPCGQIVYVFKRLKNPEFVAQLNRKKGQEMAIAKGFFEFKPLDDRMPMVKCAFAECPQGFQDNYREHMNSLYAISIIDWPRDSHDAVGKVNLMIGLRGTIEAENLATRVTHDLSSDDFSDDVNADLPVLPWSIPEEEIKKRWDLRKECIFTIDPATARDLDDAVSIKELPGPDGTYEVGVHIADVSYFVSEHTALDQEARNRATSVYFPDRVIPMLPRPLCEELCSLNPEVDRLAFSVKWVMDAEGNIRDTKFNRSVICSCMKMSYEVAQEVIERGRDADWSDRDYTPHGGHTWSTVSKNILILDKMAKAMRHRRFENGALRLDRTRLNFTLDPVTKIPIGYWAHVQKDANKLIEEFMLQANMSVAEAIYHKFPHHAMLRRHPEPDPQKLHDVKVICAKHGIELDVTSAQNLELSLRALRTGAHPELAAAVNSMLIGPMEPALYFITDFVKEDDFRHYALNVPFYTHFTSPIRRYPDIVVHRELLCLIEERNMKTPPDLLQEWASHCNNRKLSSKRAQEDSENFFLFLFLQHTGPAEFDAVVINIFKPSFRLAVLGTSVEERVEYQQTGLKNWEPKPDRHFVATFKDGSKLFVKLFQKIRVRMSAVKDKKLTVKFELLNVQYDASEDTTGEASVPSGSV
eukprot:Clim_evm23s13 gene=Clim_evmTU23s13